MGDRTPDIFDHEEEGRSKEEPEEEPEEEQEKVEDSSSTNSAKTLKIFNVYLRLGL